MESPPVKPLTFKDITEVYRTERKSRHLTEIRKDFYEAAIDFIDGLRKETEKSCNDPFSLTILSLSDTIKKASAKVIQIFEIRAEKILLMALRASSGAEVTTDSMTPEEKRLFTETLESLERRRRNIFSPKTPPALITEPTSVSEKSQIRESISTQMEDEGQVLTVEEKDSAPADQPLSSDVQEESVLDEDYLIVRILEDIPPFAGPERDYELSKEDVVILPALIARALISRGKAEEIRARK